MSTIDTRRGESILTRLVDDRLLRPKDIHVPAPPAIADLLRFHTPAHLENMALADRLGPIFGLLPEVTDVDGLLDAARLAVGGTVEATNFVVANGGVAINLGGGFHHAEPDRASGFCVFNDVGVAIEVIRASGWTGRVAIVDLDYHQGNGNSAAYENDDDVLVFSIHGSVWRLADDEFQIHLEGKVDDKRYLDCLNEHLAPALTAFRPDIVFYIAGSDVLALDALGSFDLTLEGVLERDRHVLEVAKSQANRVVVTMAGGYSKDAWIAFYNLARLVLGARVRTVRPKRGSLRMEFAAIAAKIDPNELTDDDDNWLTEEDLLADLAPVRRASKVLDFYTRHGVEVALERYGFYQALRRRGFSGFECSVDPSDPSHQLIRIRGVKAPDTTLHLLVEAVVRLSTIVAPYDEDVSLQVLEVKWLLLQDPTAQFSLRRPRLPGQDHPGLGLARQVLEFLIRSAKRLSLAGVLNHPSHFHNAAVAGSELHFIDPTEEGQFRALVRLFGDQPLDVASRIVADGNVRHADGRPLEWSAGARLLGLTPELIAHFESAAYRDAVEAAANEVLTVVDPAGNA